MTAIKPTFVKVIAGWMALGDGWAVIAPSREEAQRNFYEAIRRHTKIMARVPMEPEA